jgi:streptomycin 6-kinase
MRIPATLAHEFPEEREWLLRLPSLAAECASTWGLELEEPFETPHSLVVPAGDAVLKFNAPSHFEADHEADALEVWAGGGAVRLLARDDERRALLLERCRPGTTLAETAVDDVSVVAELLPRLEAVPPARHPFRLLADEAARWAEEVPRRYELGARPFEPKVLDAAVDVFRTAEPAASFLANQDLHGWNVLSAERESWLVIDPKPLVGERELDGVGLLRNAAFTGSVAVVRRWLDALAGLGLDRERARGWGAAHALAWGWDERRGRSPRSVAAATTILSA